MVRHGRNNRRSCLSCRRQLNLILHTHTHWCTQGAIASSPQPRLPAWLYQYSLPARQSQQYYYYALSYDSHQPTQAIQHACTSKTHTVKRCRPHTQCTRIVVKTHTHQSHAQWILRKTAHAEMLSVAAMPAHTTKPTATPCCILQHCTTVHTTHPAFNPHSLGSCHMNAQLACLTTATTTNPGPVYAG
jgi:hypothetical protein